jgi:hypothetical protein
MVSCSFTKKRVSRSVKRFERAGNMASRGQRAHWSLVLLSTATYAVLCATGIRLTVALAQGDGDSLAYDVCKWSFVLAVLYIFESLLAQFTAYTVFPRWETIHLLKHHVPYAGVVFYSMLAENVLGKGHVFHVFRWACIAVLMTQGNEACECFQTLGGERWLHELLGMPLPLPTEDVPGLVEKARITFATLGVTQVAMAETHDVIFAWWRAINGSGEWYYALHSLFFVPALQFHYKLVQKYWSRIGRWQRAAWGITISGDAPSKKKA